MQVRQFLQAQSDKDSDSIVIFGVFLGLACRCDLGKQRNRRTEELWVVPCSSRTSTAYLCLCCGQLACMCLLQFGGVKHLGRITSPHLPLGPLSGGEEGLTLILLPVRSCWASG